MIFARQDWLLRSRGFICASLLIMELPYHSVYYILHICSSIFGNRVIILAGSRIATPALYRNYLSENLFRYSQVGAFSKSWERESTQASQDLFSSSLEHIPKHSRMWLVGAVLIQVYDSSKPKDLEKRFRRGV